MMMPSYELYKRMVGAHGGVWAELVNDGTVEIAMKLSADLIKSVWKGAPVTLIIAAVENSGGKSVRIVGVQIEDDKHDPVVVHGPQEKAREQRNFERLLTVDHTFVTFYDELVRPVMAGRVYWDGKCAKAELRALKESKPHYVGGDRALLNKAMDVVEAALTAAHRCEYQSEHDLCRRLQLHFEDLHPVGVSTPEAGTFVLDDPDEGGGLEKSAYLVLEANFPGTSHLNPQVENGVKRREFCDVLVLGAKDILIIQSKVMAILDRHLDQIAKRRVTNVHGHFQKAVSQLSGSIRALRQGKLIYTSDGRSIQISLQHDTVIHGVVLLSSMNLALPWPEMTHELLAASQKSQAKFHVLDFAELQQHVAFGKTLLQMSSHLSKRFDVVLNSGNANARTKFLEDENRPIASAPIDNEAWGYVFTLEIDQGAKSDAGEIFKIFRSALTRRRFTGRCEYFQDIGLLFGEKFCWISLGIQWSREAEEIPSYDWWIDFREEVRPELDAVPGVKLTHLSEMATLENIRASKTLALVTEFVDGKAVGFFDPDETKEEDV